MKVHKVGLPCTRQSIHLMRNLVVLVVLVCSFAFTRMPQAEYDIVLRNGVIYDGTGSEPIRGDVAIRGERIVAIGDVGNVHAKKELQLNGLTVAPGFINMLSWADQSLLLDGRSMSDIKQGVTLEVLGEGWSPGPVRRNLRKPVDSLWTTLGGYFDWVMKKGISPNIASFVGATTVRVHELEKAKRAPTLQELERMKKLVAAAMEDGAMGLGSSLIYAPADYASTEELIELARVASAYGGMYATHMRSEGDYILIALNEALRIAREADIAAEIYHLKINLPRNWNKLDTILAKIDSARNAGLRITADHYPYVASATGLTARLPNWVQEGGAVQMRRRLRDPRIRAKVLSEMRQGIPYKNSSPETVMLLDFRLDSLDRLFKGKRLDQAARIYGKDEDETVIDLLITDRSPIPSVYYQQSEVNVRKFVALPYVSFCSDAPSLSDAKAFENWGTHPRTYGSFARILGKYVREERLLTLQEAIRKLTGLPASNLKLVDRGLLREGYFADLAIFDPDKITDHATFENPRVYATGMVHVFVNGVQVLSNGEHTGATPGQVVRGPGYRKGR